MNIRSAQVVFTPGYELVQIGPVYYYYNWFYNKKMAELELHEEGGSYYDEEGKVCECESTESLINPVQEQELVLSFFSFQC